MHNFEYKNPTKLIFGTHQIEKLASELQALDAKKVMLVYGGGSIKKNGTYEEVVAELNNAGIDFVDFSGVEPNPRIETVRRAVKQAREENIDALLAVGGGSVIDCTKLISAAIPYEGDAWDIVLRDHIPTEAVPFGTVLTLAATGSEMNSGSVITNWETQEKYGWGHPLVYPTFSILDPRYTVSVPKDQTIYGIVDMMSHCFEQYFHPNHAPVQERMTEGVLKAVVESAPKLVNDLENVDLRAIILFAGTIALNGVLQMGASGDWASHNIEHAVSAVHDIPHAGGLAILFPRWMEHVLEEDNAARFARLGTEVFNVEPADSDLETAKRTIAAVRAFFDELGAPSSLRDYDIDESTFDAILDSAMKRGAFGRFRTLEREDVAAILELSK
ncbi:MULTISPECIES: iron-containing alcohol dehydrogenase [Exiguobacterium]|uniref:iron-containing alcohol dehydrogenase n=1 Tax=Exiguobacterium TaxID=33986 RepID=UPI001BECCB5C|nr:MULTISPECIES: iron-containing alcohol dehydrogenase [Exiguobacterium]MCT4777620.1 iron-containing alcohol dehydrogenase [Exiguobacterium aquaticum]MCT4789750.1 iron-containing alcohol dehydrogenase [Exiguobacterium mexicanum]